MPERETVYRYLVVGGSTALGYITAAFFLNYSLDWPTPLSSMTAFLVMLPVAYAGHKWITFKSSEAHRKEFPKFILAACAGFVLSVAIPWCAVDCMGMKPLVGYLAACVIVPVFNYFLAAEFVFLEALIARRRETTALRARTGTSPIEQDYRPYRQHLLSADELRRMSSLQPAKVVIDTLWLWCQILAIWALVAVWPAWWSVLLSIPAIGTRYYALFIIGHDGLHRRLFRSASSNDTWNDVFVLAPILAITRLNRWNHMAHHRLLACISDPDRYKYISANKPDKITVLAILTGIPYLARAVRNVLWEPAHDYSAPDNNRRYTFRDLALILGWQVALVSGLTVAIGWWAYPVLWLLPVYLFAYTADIVRVFLEHSMPCADKQADSAKRLVTYTSNAVERVFLAPKNMNLHAAHHLWPSIPYYNLPQADQLMRQRHKKTGNLVWRKSYLSYLLQYLHQLPWSSTRTPERT